MPGTHTPAPWHVKRAEIRVDGEYDFAIYDANKQVIAEVFARTSPTNFPPAEANAPLITAAPELLTALKAMVQSYDGIRDILTSDVVLAKLAAADAAIAKAEGR